MLAPWAGPSLEWTVGGQPMYISQRPGGQQGAGGALYTGVGFILLWKDSLLHSTWPIPPNWTSSRLFVICPWGHFVSDFWLPSRLTYLWGQGLLRACFVSPRPTELLKESSLKIHLCRDNLGNGDVYANLRGQWLLHGSHGETRGDSVLAFG